MSLYASISGTASPPDLDVLFKAGGIQTFIRIIMGLPLLIFPLIIIYGGFMYMIAAGNDQNLQKAKSTITWGIIGFVITMLAYGLVMLVTKLVGVNNVDPTKLPAPSF